MRTFAWFAGLGLILVGQPVLAQRPLQPLQGLTPPRGKPAEQTERTLVDRPAARSTPDASSPSRPTSTTADAAKPAPADPVRDLRSSLRRPGFEALEINPGPSSPK